jgi:hypothetical protein
MKTYTERVCFEKNIYTREGTMTTLIQYPKKTKIIVTSACLEGRKKKGLMHVHAYRPVNWIYPNRRKPSKYSLWLYQDLHFFSMYFNKTLQK